MNDDFRVCGLYSGDHSQCGTMLCIDYAVAFVGAGEEDPIENQMKDFAKQAVQFKDMPEDYQDYKDKRRIWIEGKKLFKKVTRTCTYSDERANTEHYANDERDIVCNLQ